MNPLSLIELNIVEKLKTLAQFNEAYKKLVQQVSEGLIRKYWLEDRSQLVNSELD